MANILSIAGDNSKYKMEDADPAGFLGGLWHGIISPITFLVSLISQDIRIYETRNNGRWYDFGFCLGAGILFSQNHYFRVGQLLLPHYRSTWKSEAVWPIYIYK